MTTSPARQPQLEPARCALPDSPLADVMAGMDACVHCGFCLQACPTYIALEDENDSPRGRILLMRAVAEGALAPDDAAVARHIDQCLGCRACETACPSGVPYGTLLEATRATIGAERRLPFVARLILRVFASVPLLRLAMALGRLARATRVSTLLTRAPGRMGVAMAMLEATRPPDILRDVTMGTRRRAREVGRTPRSGGDGAGVEVERRGRVALLRGCVMQGLYCPTNRATERVLIANGYQMVAAPGQRCCGALHAHAGDLETARRLARHNVRAMEASGADMIAVNAAGCGAMMREYGHLLGKDREWNERARQISARVRDVTELLDAAGPRRGGKLRMRVAYDAPCHLLHAQRVADQPLRVLRSIPELELVTLPGAEYCCGGAGLYGIAHPDISRQVLQPRLDEVRDSEAQLVATGNPGCLMQIGAGLLRSGSAARVVHPVDLLDASYSVRPPGGAPL